MAKTADFQLAIDRWLIALLALLVTSCAPTASIGSGPSRFTGSFIADMRPSQLLYLSLTQSGSGVSGFLVLADPDGSGGIKSQTVQMTGSTDEDAITLNGSGLFGLSAFVLTGRKRTTEIAMTFPAKSGAIGTTTFRAASEAEFNQTLGQWRQQVADDYGRAQRAAASAAALASAAAASAAAVARMQKAVADADNALGRALDDLAASVRKLATVTFDSTLAAYAKNWKTMQADYTLMMKDAAVRPFTCYQRATVAYDAGSVTYDLGSIQYDDGSLTYDLNGAASRRDELVKRMQSVRNAVAALTSALSANTTSYPSPRYSAADADNALATAQKQRDATDTLIQTAKTQAAKYDADAKQLNDAAQKFVASLTCSG